MVVINLTSFLGFNKTPAHIFTEHSTWVLRFLVKTVWRYVFNIKAEEDMKKLIHFVFADMKYHDLMEEMEKKE